MRENGVNRIKAKTTKIVIGKGEVNSLFVKLENARDIRKGQVNKLYHVLEAGENFETPLMTHLVLGRHKLLDGNHRLEAIKKYLEKYPDRKVEVWIFYYEGLNDNEEKQLYTKWNGGIKQSTNDFVQQYWKTIPITSMFVKNSFPVEVSHRWSSKAIEFKTLIGAYLTKNNPTFAGGFNGSAMDFIEESRNLNKDDYLIIKEFLKDYITVFGNPDKDNVHYRQAVFYSIMRIWLDNRKTVGYDKLQQAMKRIVNCRTVIAYQKLGGTRENCIACRNELLAVINGRYSTNKVFV